MKKRIFVCFFIFFVCLFYLLIPAVVFGQAIQVFNKYEDTFKHPDVHEFFPDVLNAFKDPENQVFLNSALIGRFADKPRSMRNLYEKIDDSILTHLLLDGQFQALFKDQEFHNMLQSSNQIDTLVRLIRQTMPIPPDTACPLPPQPQPEPEPEPRRATKLSIVSGDDQSGESGLDLAQPFVVGVLDQDGKPHHGTQVTFTVSTAGGGQLSGQASQTIFTDVYGQARTTLTLGRIEGRTSVTASVFDLGSQTFTATAIAPEEPEPEPIPPEKPSVSAQLPPVYWIEGGVLYYRPTGGEKKMLWKPRGGTLTGGLAVDMVRGRVYWTEQTGADTEQTGADTGRIRWFALDEMEVRSLPVVKNGVPYGVAVDAEKGRVYWTTSQGRIQRIDVDGSDFRRDFIVDLNSPKHIAFDEEQRKLYWTEVGRIRSANPNGLNRSLVEEDLSELGGIAVGDRKVYWTEKTGSGQGKVKRENGNGSGAKLLAVLESVPEGIAVDTVGGKVYWTTSLGEIQSAPLTGTIQTVVEGKGTRAVGLALVPESMGAAPSVAAPLASSVHSEGSVLLANYPNPFNPETWIPYQLSEPVEVTVSIYSVNGSLIRTLALGHQSAGVYQSKSRAAYWDGRNAFGERVASGLYFYTLTAGDFTATRKMLIRK